MTHRLIRAVAALPLVAATAFAQPATCAPAPGGPRSAAIQPRVIVIPFTKEGEDIRTVLENDFGRQIALAKVQEAFQDRQFATVDFMGALQAMKRGTVATSESERDFRDRLFEANQADIYVTTNFQVSKQGGATSVTMILSAYMTANGQSVGSRTGRSQPNMLADTAAHVERALKDITGPLLDQMQGQFCQFQDDGVPLNVELRVARNAASNLDSKAAGKQETIGDIMENWFEANAHKAGYRVSNRTPNMMQLADVRMAIRDANGRYGSPSRFGSSIAAYLRTLGVRASSSVTNGAIYVDIK
jgi:hypothetical protein